MINYTSEEEKTIEENLEEERYSNGIEVFDVADFNCPNCGKLYDFCSHYVEWLSK